MEENRNSDMLASSEERRKYKSGLISALGCSGFWGIMPIYWHLLRPIDSAVIIFYRILLVAIVCFAAALYVHGWEAIKAPLRQKGVKLRYFLAGLLITFNWSLYIWAVNADFVIQTCIGYYLEPLMVCIFGVIIFKEKLTGSKVFALVLGLIGLMVMLIGYGQAPFIALGLAISFSSYAAVKKNYQMPALLSLLYETMFLAPIALAVIIYLEANGQGALGVEESYKYWLMMLCGLFTAFPLGLFSSAANKIPLFTLGLTEYLSPTLALIIGIYLFKEPFDAIQFVAFAIIWIGLVIFSVGEYREYKSQA